MSFDTNEFFEIDSDTLKIIEFPEFGKKMIDW